MTEPDDRPTIGPPAPCLPPWARSYYARWVDRYAALELPHRVGAFQRLLCTDDAGMARVWGHLNAAGTENRDLVIGTLILAMDEAIKPTPVPRYGRLPAPPRVRLAPRQTRARKLARLLRELSHVTPSRCHAARNNRAEFGLELEALCTAYRIELDPLDLDRVRSRYCIEHKSDSKRGFVEHRRASDTARRKALAAARELLAHDGAQMPDYCARLLTRVVAELESWPDFEAEHTTEPEHRSQKSGWADWLRRARHEWRNWSAWNDAPSPDATLDAADWATLARTLFDVEITAERIRQILDESR